jgi:DNA (cytosine-5)-methyltransferase 1
MRVGVKDARTAGVAPRLRRRPTTSARRRTLDLFCGAGGIALGFEAAGFSCLYGADADPLAMQTFAGLFPAAVADCRPIETIDATEVRAALRLRSGDLDVLVGGPPCQGFSINAPERFLSDPRNVLFRHYLRFVEELRPKCIMLENVPGMLSLGGGRVLRQIETELAKLGYRSSARVLLAAHYGVPQERWRLVLLGALGEDPPEHPAPTHYAPARANFTGGADLIFRQGAAEAASLSPAVTVGDALGDLPRLEAGRGSEPSGYDRPPHSAYAKEMRADDGVLWHHVAPRLSPANLERMRHVPPGGSWRDIPQHLLPAGMRRARRSDHTKRYGRLRYDGLAGTVMTKADPHWGTVVLPDQDRALTVREAARLQSFPDCCRFAGSRTDQYRQVGNAVPPLMAEAVARRIAAWLETTD